MEVILTQDVENIGKAGQIIKAKDGFVRNYLFPKKLALAATAANRKRLEDEQKQKNQQYEKIKSEAMALKDRLEKLSLTIPVLVQEKEKLYGSISAQELCKALNEEGFQIEEKSILLEEPIKTLGIYEVPVKLHAEVSSQVKVWIVKK
ncbi:MAG TPA: 50S ribosomal protein L9 [Candidatus Omnitrophota bacterium]|nr:50S ribosomal protein L9 [Candidatus Omnitrophota bacterium]HRZ15739.1 50S ribosomal protein L9 [Candidatus Omnitrophota bacterium]